MLVQITRKQRQRQKKVQDVKQYLKRKKNCLVESGAHHKKSSEVKGGTPLEKNRLLIFHISWHTYEQMV